MTPRVLMPELAPVLRRDYRLRWRFEYANRKARQGVWNGVGKGQKDPTSAWCQPKDGLTRAIIEGEHLQTGVVVPLVDVPGQDYAHMQWEKYAPIPGVMGLGSAPIQPKGRLSALKMWTRDEIITVFIDGTVSRQTLTQKINFYEHRAGT